MNSKRGVNRSQHRWRRERFAGKRQGPGREAKGRSRSGEPIGRYCVVSNPEGTINSGRVAAAGDRRGEHPEVGLSHRHGGETKRASVCGVEPSS